KILKNVNNKSGGNGLSQMNSGEKNDLLSLRQLVESYKDEPEFIRNYLSTYEKEFTSLPKEVKKYSLQKDCKSLAELIHKTSPSIQRIENSTLPEELNQLRGILSDSETSEEEIFEMTNEIKKSCDDVVAHIQELWAEYVGS